ncbi:MAG TPA: hypothetical protein VFI08_02815, partial [Spirochaetia bacterium]|nr:hypothetical protein [Spirochaetia bacterium]
WKLLSLEQGFRLPAGSSSRVVLASFFVSRRSRAGTYAVTLSALDADAPSEKTAGSVAIVVPARPRLEVSLLGAPESVLAGERCRAVFAVRNTGNVGLTAAVSVHSSVVGMAPLLSEHAVSLDAGEYRTVTVVAQTSEDLRQLTRQALVVSALSKAPLSAEANATALVQVIPRVTEHDVYHRFPVRAGVEQSAAGGNGTDLRTQLEVSGDGTLDGAQTQHVMFEARRQFVSQDPLAATEDEYRARYWTDTLNVDLGDHAYAMSPLTEESFLARGAQADVSLGALQLGGYYAASRWQEPGVQEAAGYVGLASDGSQARAVYLRAAGSTERQVAAFAGSVSPVSDLSLGVECANGLRTGHDSAVLVQLDGVPSWARFTVRGIHAETGFPGTYGSRDTVTSSLVVPVGSLLSLAAHFNQQRVSANDSLLAGIVLNDSYGAGIDYRDPQSAHAAASWYSFMLRDCACQETRWNTVSLTLGHGIGFAQVSTTVAATFTSSPAGPSPVRSELSTSVGLGPQSRHTVTGFVSCVGLPWNRQDLQASCGVGYEGMLSDRMPLTFRYAAGDILPPAVRHDQFDLAAAYNLPDRSRFMFGGSYTAFHTAAQRDVFQIVVGYSMPFDIPVSRTMDTGEVAGRVFDAQSGKGLANVVVRLNGSVAVTNASGQFVFPNLAIGTQYLQVDTSRLGTGLVTTGKSPFPVEIKKDQRTQLSVGVAHAAAVSGRVSLYRYRTAPGGPGSLAVAGDGSTGSMAATGSALDLDHGAGGVVVELSNGSETLREVTDRDGSFAFAGVRPGPWELTVRPDSLPDSCRLQDNPGTLTLAPGETREVGLRVVPIVRSIRIMDGGGVLRDGGGQ